MRLGNQSRDIDQLTDDVGHEDLQAATAALLLEISRHPPSPTCNCAVIEGLAVLYERGYRLVKAS